MKIMKLGSGEFSFFFKNFCYFVSRVLLTGIVSFLWFYEIDMFELGKILKNF